MKRTVDTLLVVLTLPLWGPVAALVALAVLLAMGRPVFFRQERAGLRGKPFKILKFRTMRPGTEPDEERLTKLGRFLRRTSLDELPQLWNVLRGEMSLVGPRPLPVRYLPRYSRVEMRRHDVLPGITGLAQTAGRNDLPWRGRFRLDLWYVRHVSACLDARILLSTVLAVFTGRGYSQELAEFRPQ